MAKKIYFPALQSDIILFYKKMNGWLSNSFIGGLIVVSFIWFGFVDGLSFIGVLVVIGVIKHVVEYYRIKNLEKRGRVLFIKKKKNERQRSIIYGVLFLFLASISSFEETFSILIGFLALYHFMKALFYIPSTVFIANDYELIVKRKRKYKSFDFSYPNRLRFVYNMISFDHPVYGKDSWKDINMDRDKMNEIRLFLANNFGKEMVLNPTTGLPYTI